MTTPAKKPYHKKRHPWKNQDLRSDAKRALGPRQVARDGWTPVRNGDVYCSPLCGGGPRTCTIQNYERAVDLSNKVAADLGPGWTTRVHENLGWRCSVTSPCRRIRITVPTRTGDTGYTAFLGPIDEHDMCVGRWAENGRTPREAIENVLNAARHDLGLIAETIEGLAVPALRKHSRGVPP